MHIRGTPLLLAAALLHFATTPLRAAEKAAPGKHKITGTTLDASGHPVSGAQIRVETPDGRVVAHSHSFATTIRVAPGAESASASCPQCAFAAHSPLAAPASPSLQHAPDIGATVTGPPPVGWCPPALSSPPGRGPPASA